MDLEEIKRYADDAESATSATREEASQMLVFGRIGQWDDDFGGGTQLKFRGQFDLIKPKRNKILSELWANPVSVTFKPQDGADEDTADVLNGLFRRTMQMGEEATETAIMDQVDCGMGAFRFCTDYRSKLDDMDNTQYIKIEPINEANNRVYMDSNSKRKDKSDAKWGLIISTFTRRGWETFCEENGINYEENKTPTSFKAPNTTNTWFWRSKKDEINIGEFYAKERKKERVLIFESPLGERVSYLQKEIKKVEQELQDGGFIKIGEKMRETWRVTKYLVDGERIIKKYPVAGEYIPIVPIYGDWSYVEGREIWRGIYYDAQDPQRLHNTLMSYTTDIVMQGPRQKPIFYEGQIQGYEFMYHENGADDNFAYKLMHEISPITGQPYPNAPISYLEPPQVPNAQAFLMQQTRQAIDDVTGSSMNSEQMLNSQVTEGQIAAAQNNTNMETFLYQNSVALAMKHAGRVFASMAKEIIDIPQELTITDETGKEREVSVMEAVFDYETGEEVVLNDVTKGRFETYVDTGPNYSTQRDQAKAEMIELFKATQGTPEGNIALMTYISLQEGPGYEDFRKYANKQLILMGIKEPETDEEKAMLEQAQQQQQQPDPNMIFALAEKQKAENEAIKDQANAANEQAKVQVDAFNAETKRIDVMASNSLKQVDAAKKASEIRGNELDQLQTMAQAFMPRTVQ